MTLILSVAPGSCPILFGDLLISGNENTEKVVSIPGVGKATNVFPEGSGFTIANLTQKVNIINDRFAIAWAGSHIAARAVIKDLEELSKSPNFSSETISRYFENIDEEIEKHGVSFIALFIGKIEANSVQATTVTHNINYYPSTPFGPRVTHEK